MLWLFGPGNIHIWTATHFLYILILLSVPIDPTDTATARRGAIFARHADGKAGKQDCVDAHAACQLWVNKNQCLDNPYFMREQCAKACNVCQTFSLRWRGHATDFGTRLYATMYPGASKSTAEGHFRKDPSMGSYNVPGQHVRGDPWLMLSSMGTGTYLGASDLPTDDSVASAIISAVHRGWNVIDSARNYRDGHGERAVNIALNALSTVPGLTRDMLFLTTKAGFLDTKELQKLRTKGLIKGGDIIGGVHCIHPACLDVSLQHSLDTMQVATVDVLYLHNVAEMQAPAVGTAGFMTQLQAAFSFLEQARTQNLIRAYGMATWDCFRKPPTDGGHLSLQDVVQLAEKAGGPDHGFRYIQLPVNVAKPEAWAKLWQTVTSKKGSRRVSLLEAAAELGVGAFASGPLGEGDLLQDSVLKAKLEKVPELSNIQDYGGKLLQIARSTPLLLSTIVGQKTSKRVASNLLVGGVPPLNSGQFDRVVKELGIG